MTAAMILSLLLAAINNAAGIAALLATLQAEKRDATPAEWAALFSADAAARQALVDAIARALAAPAVPNAAAAVLG